MKTSLDFTNKLRYSSVYNPMIYLLNKSNLWVKTKYPHVKSLKYRKMSGRPNKRKNLEHGEIYGSNHKMRKTILIVKCSGAIIYDTMNLHVR